MLCVMSLTSSLALSVICRAADAENSFPLMNAAMAVFSTVAQAYVSSRLRS